MNHVVPWLHSIKYVRSQCTVHKGAACSLNSQIPTKKRHCSSWPHEVYLLATMKPCSDFVNLNVENVVHHSAVNVSLFCSPCVKAVLRLWGHSPLVVSRCHFPSHANISCLGWKYKHSAPKLQEENLIVIHSFVKFLHMCFDYEGTAPHFVFDRRFGAYQSHLIWPN